MGSKTVVEKDYRRFEPVGQRDVCEDCPSACKTSCARKLAQSTDNKVSYVVMEEEEFIVSK